jgi:hypothetical protein
MPFFANLVLDYDAESVQGRAKKKSSLQHRCLGKRRHQSVSKDD